MTFNDLKQNVIVLTPEQSSKLKGGSGNNGGGDPSIIH